MAGKRITDVTIGSLSAAAAADGDFLFVFDISADQTKRMSFLEHANYVQTKLAATYATPADIVSALASYVTSANLTTTLANYVLTSALTTALTDYMPKTGGTFTGPIVATTVRAKTPVSAQTTGTLTIASADTIVRLTGATTIPASVFAADTTIILAPGGANRTVNRGAGLTMMHNGTNTAAVTANADTLVAIWFETTTKCVVVGAFNV